MPYCRCPERTNASRFPLARQRRQSMPHCSLLVKIDGIADVFPCSWIPITFQARFYLHRAVDPRTASRGIRHQAGKQVRWIRDRWVERALSALRTARLRQQGRIRQPANSQHHRQHTVLEKRVLYWMVGRTSARSCRRCQAGFADFQFRKRRILLPRASATSHARCCFDARDRAATLTGKQSGDRLKRPVAWSRWRRAIRGGAR